MEVKLEQVKGIGPSLLHHFRNQNIWSTYDLILHIPRSYEDFTVRSLSAAKNLEKITIQGDVISSLKENPYGKVHVITFDMKVADDSISVVVFNRKYIMKTIQKNARVIVKGTYHLYQKKIIASYVSIVSGQAPIKPVYKIEGVYDRKVQHIIKQIFDEHQVDIFETIPQSLIKKYHLPERAVAYRMLHIPHTFQDVKIAERRFKYEEAFFLQLKLVANQLAQTKRNPKVYKLDRVKQFITSLPYTLTTDQKQATNDIFRDFKQSHSTMRLIQGDVGSGKTIVSLIAAYAVVTSGEQVAFMAPTTLLANQHYTLCKTLFKTLNIALLTHNTENKHIMKQAIVNGEYDIVIGTHALIEKDVSFKKLGLIIIDEQHKFGVHTRQTLIEKGQAKDVIYLTATPIPRTLAMIAFGESQVSIIKQKPAERQPVITTLVDQKNEQKVWKAVQSAVHKGHHVFVVVPAITSELVTDNIMTTAKKLQSTDYPLYILHGQLSKEEQTHVMTQFRDTPGSVLLSTTMVEVGIDIPTATCMVILSAHQFGLAQLHQLRGRIGRGKHVSTCYLVSEKQDLERLSLMTETNDGFKLSAYDLKARGPGDFIGTEQSGYLSFHFLDLSTDERILHEAQKNVRELLEKPDFWTHKQYAYLRKHIKESLKI